MLIDLFNFRSSIMGEEQEERSNAQLRASLNETRVEVNAALDELTRLKANTQPGPSPANTTTNTTDQPAPTASTTAETHSTVQPAPPGPSDNTVQPVPSQSSISHHRHEQRLERRHQQAMEAAVAEAVENQQVSISVSSSINISIRILVQSAILVPRFVRTMR